MEEKKKKRKRERKKEKEKINKFGTIVMLENLRKWGGKDVRGREETVRQKKRKKENEEKGENSLDGTVFYKRTSLKIMRRRSVSKRKGQSDG